MLKKRIIPTLLWKKIGVVKGERFDSWRNVGSIMPSIKIYNRRDVDGLIILNIPFSYYFLQYDLPPYIIVVISILISIIAFFVRFYFYSKYYKRSKLKVLKELLIPSVLVLLFSLILPYIVIINYQPSILRFIISSFTCIISVILFTYLFGLKAQEKNILKTIIKNYN